jgi:hypothetical protein
MSRWADWFPITQKEAERFLNAATMEGDEAVHLLLEPLLERQGKLPLHVDMDKAWEPIHRCLTEDHTPGGGLDVDGGRYPLNLCVFGGEGLLEEGYRSAWLVRAEQVADLAEEIFKVSRFWFRARFFELPDDQFHEIDETMFEWAWAHFRDLPPFFLRAARQKAAVICTISH